MSQSKHTEAPWTVEAGDLWSITVPLIPHGATRVTIAQAALEADARLIAAAPELLAALIATTERLVMLQGEAAPTVAEARAALAKATPIGDVQIKEV